MNRYKISPRKKYLWANEPKCQLGISIGQTINEGEQLESTLLWIAKEFSSLHIWIADLLHRHDMMFQYCESIEEATIRSRIEGDKWIVRNSEILETLKIPWTISRWEKWLNDPRYNQSRLKIQNLYENSFELQNAVANDAKRFMDGYIKKGKKVHDMDFALSKCSEFVLEENAVFPMLIEDYGGINLGYSSELESTKLIRSEPLIGAPEMLYKRTHARIFVKTNKNIEEQQDNIDFPTAANE